VLFINLAHHTHFLVEKYLLGNSYHYSMTTIADLINKYWKESHMQPRDCAVLLIVQSDEDHRVIHPNRPWYLLALDKHNAGQSRWKDTLFALDGEGRPISLSDAFPETGRGSHTSGVRIYDAVNPITSKHVRQYESMTIEDYLGIHYRLIGKQDLEATKIKLIVNDSQLMHYALEELSPWLKYKLKEFEKYEKIKATRNQKGNK
jgi:hypothetical protein